MVIFWDLFGKREHARDVVEAKPPETAPTRGTDYIFANDVRWAVCEGIQADVLNHVQAIAPEFGLQVHQRPSGRDFEEIVRDAV